MNTIHLTLDDDINSVCDRLDWSDDKRVVFVLPDEGARVLSSLSLMQLRRYADGKRIEVGLVTTNRQLGRQARGLGLPAFATVEEAETSRRGWWRGRRRQERLGLPTYGESLDDGKPPQKVKVDDGDFLTTPVNTPRQWFLRYAAILLFFVAGGLAVVSFLYLIPRATITLQPELYPLTATKQITAVPTLDEIDYTQNTIPARLLTITQTWKTEIDTTGIIDVPTAPARGRIVFTNVTSETVTIPAGTIVRTADGSGDNVAIGFQIAEEVIVVGVEGGTAETDAIALEPGPQGNVAREMVTVLPQKLAELVEVRNPAPMVGGDLRAEAAITQADLTRVRSQALQFLQAVTLSEMEGMLTEREFLARESMQVVEIVSESYSHTVGEQTAQVSVEMEVVLQGTAVNTTIASSFVYEALASQVTTSFSLVPDSIQYGEAEVVSADEAGNVTFLLTGDGAMSADLDLTEAMEMITGQEPDTAVAFLRQTLPLRNTPTVQVWPLWVKRMPYLARRIQSDIRTDG